MPTIFSHAAVPIALGLGMGTQILPRRLILAGVLASIVPDFDVIAFKLGIPYADAFGHRGFSHSLIFAFGLACIAFIFAKRLKINRMVAFTFITLCAASHGLLDMFTNGGQGVALWWPFSEARLFAPWQVIEVSPIGLVRFLSERGLDVLRSEFLWVWLPATAVCVILFFSRRKRPAQSFAP